MRRETLQVRGMDCTGCEERLRRVLSRLEGVAGAEPDHERQEVTLTFDEGKVSLGQLKARIERIGFDVL